MENSADHLIGTQLGTCVLNKLIGSGGMGMVYLARQLRPTREVAVKVLRSGLEEWSERNQEFLARFRREANVIAQLDHINILPLYEYGEQDNMAYLVMPYLTGGSLREVLEQRGVLSPQEALTYLEQAAAALQYAHEHKIVHRDIKPANMLFHADGRLVLVDFGIAHIIREHNDTGEVSLTGSSHFLGSVEYMAPEMVSGQKVDNRTDIYELGIVLFQMLSGRVPFQAETPLMLAIKHIEEIPPYLPNLNSGISVELDAVVHKAIAKKPDERYNSVSEFAQAMRQAVLRPASFPAPTSLSSNSAHYTPTQLPPHQSAPSYNLTNVAQPPYLGYQTQTSETMDRPMSPPAQNAVIAPQTYPQSYTPQIFQTGVDVPALKGTPGHKKSGERWLIWLIALCLIGGVIASGIYWGPQFLQNIGLQVATPTAVPTSAPTPTSPPSPTTSPEQQASTVIQNYYADINKADYLAAYQLWGSDYQSKNPYSHFAGGFATTRHDDVTIDTVTQQNDGTYKIVVVIKATNRDNTIHIFRGYYIVGLENAVLKMLPNYLIQES